jgi:hypothetical protein
MEVYILSYYDNSFQGAYINKEDAYKEFNENKDIYKEPFLYEIIVSTEELEEVIDNTIIGHCVHCSTSLTKQNVVYDCDRKPFGCQDCLDKGNISIY